MIAPTGRLRKGPGLRTRLAAGIRTFDFGWNKTYRQRHGIVSGIIIPPHFCPPRALLACEK
jgi:hypothetical protein